MKRCSRCKEEKDKSQFQQNCTTDDGLQDQCKACRKETDRISYLNRTTEQKARNNEWQKQNIKRNLRQTYEYLLTHPCVDCGEPDPVVLEFDHILGDKHGNVADLLRSGRTWERILIEIEKCEVRCANCHRRATAQRSGTWRHKWNLDNIDDVPT